MPVGRDHEIDSLTSANHAIRAFAPRPVAKHAMQIVDLSIA